MAKESLSKLYEKKDFRRSKSRGRNLFFIVFFMSDTTHFGDISRETLDRSDDVVYSTTLSPGITEEVVRYISHSNQEPLWMLEHRLKSLEIFQSSRLPTWGPSLAGLDLDSIYYFAKPE